MTVLIVGSARKESESALLAETLLKNSDWQVIDLNDYQFSYFDYDHLNRGDDFLPLMTRIIDNYDTIVFLTPVYWYAMSGIMKVFFDRISDLLTIEKPLGRKLRGKKMAVITTSYGNNLGEHFWLPFAETAKYLGMTFIGGAHTVVGENHEKTALNYIEMVNKA